MTYPAISIAQFSLNANPEASLVVKIDGEISSSELLIKLLY